jgi:prephenate dehydratase
MRGEPWGDTAGAAKALAEHPNPSRAAIAPALAAELYGLDILLADVEDEAHNTTRFLVMSTEPGQPPEDAALCVTSFVFRVRNLPAALYKALGGFATNGVNMTKLESYMENGVFTATFFYAEVDGRPGEASLDRALEELGFFSDHLEVLGVYAADPFRRRS